MIYQVYPARARAPLGPPAAKVRPRIAGRSSDSWSEAHFWPSCGGLCSLLTSLLLYVGHFCQILLKLCYFLLFFNIKNPSFSSTLSRFFTFSCFFHDLYLAFVFLMIFGDFWTSRDTKKRCTGPVFLPLGTSWVGFGAVLGNS